MGVSGQRHVPAALTPGKNTGTHFTGGWVGLRAGLDGCGEEKISCPTRFEPRTVQPVDSRYTDYSIPVGALCRRKYYFCLYHDLLLNTYHFKNVSFMSLIFMMCTFHVMWSKSSQFCVNFV